jgi:hypothetical protein
MARRCITFFFFSSVFAAPDIAQEDATSNKSRDNDKYQ